MIRYHPFCRNDHQSIRPDNDGESLMDMRRDDEIEPADMVADPRHAALSLDDIVTRNSNAMRRDSTLIQQEGNPQNLNSNISLPAFQFCSSNPEMASLTRYLQSNATTQGQQSPTGEPALDSQISSPIHSYNNNENPNFSSSINTEGPICMNMNAYIPHNMIMEMDYNNSRMCHVSNDVSAVHYYDNSSVVRPMFDQNIKQDVRSIPTPCEASRTDDITSPDFRNQESDGQSDRYKSASTISKPLAVAVSREETSVPQAATGEISVPLDHREFEYSSTPSNMPPTTCKKSVTESKFANVYSSTGFDMLRILTRVATRPQPEIDIGPVDLSCTFVVCDSRADFPIVYCSENFERLTGYTRDMIIGQNCRFLQSPTGMVAPNSKRKYVDDHAAFYLKQKIDSGKEAQVGMINYRRGGQPFMNLITIIPISSDCNSIEFFVGFQVDLVQKPNSVTHKKPDGRHSMNYQNGWSMNRYNFNTPETTQVDIGQAICRHDVSSVLSTLGTGKFELSKQIWEKMLLENSDDVVHVLSLKGIFLYLSPSSQNVLEYTAAELVGTALSSVCHPSDIVPVTRELKDTSCKTTVSVVFRIRRKHSGYMWFEGRGSLNIEHGKSRKIIILVGRERPLYAISKSEIYAAGGIGDNELWTKMSTSGMFLFVSSNSRSLLDRQPEELLGSSIQSLMSPESTTEFGQVLEMARTGKMASIKHEILSKQGEALEAITIIYPGDAVEGQKPTFFVAQTRLLKGSRGANIPLSLRETDLSVSSSCTPNNENFAYQFSSDKDLSTNYFCVSSLALGRQDASLASDENIFEELKTTRSTSWQYELRQMEKKNRLLAEELQSLLSARKSRKRRNEDSQIQDGSTKCRA